MEACNVLVDEGLRDTSDQVDVLYGAECQAGISVLGPAFPDLQRLNLGTAGFQL